MFIVHFKALEIKVPWTSLFIYAAGAYIRLNVLVTCDTFLVLLRSSGVLLQFCSHLWTFWLLRHCVRVYHTVCIKHWMKVSHDSSETIIMYLQQNIGLRMQSLQYNNTEHNVHWISTDHEVCSCFFRRNFWPVSSFLHRIGFVVHILLHFIWKLVIIFIQLCYASCCYTLGITQAEIIMKLQSPPCFKS